MSFHQENRAAPNGAAMGNETTIKPLKKNHHMKALIALLTISMLGFAGVSRAADEPAVKPYTLDYCVYTGDKLGEMGKVQTETYKGQEIKFCCKDCKKQFDKDPEAGIKKYNDAVMSKSSGGASSMPGMKMDN